jgi:hypothetical protein
MADQSDGTRPGRTARALGEARQGAAAEQVVPCVAAAPRVAVRDALVVLAACAAVGGVVNLLRPHGIPFVQKTAYQILVPCPEAGADAPGIAADDSAIWEPRTLLIDARPAAEHAAWHPDQSVHLAFDYLAPAPKAEVDRIAASGATRVVVFGDGGDPDSGEQLARELAGAGIRNVFFVRGGAKPLADAAAKSRGEPPSSGREPSREAEPSKEQGGSGGGASGRGGP